MYILLGIVLILSGGLSAICSFVPGKYQKYHMVTAACQLAGSAVMFNL